MRLKTSFLKLGLIVLLTLSGVGGLTIPSKNAYAACCSCVCNGCVRPENNLTRVWVTANFVMHQNWMVNTFWYGNILPAMMMMTNQLSAVAMQQVQIIGTFMDAQMQMETQQLLQRLQAEAHKDYQPSEGLCTIGTGVQNLAASERKGELNNIVMSKRLIDRQMRNQNTVAAVPEGDFKARIRQYAAVYCNPTDNAGQLDAFCDGGGPIERQNKDVDFTRTIDVPLTLDVDFVNNAGGASTPDEEDVMAMASHLFGSDLVSKDFNLDMIGPDGPEEVFLDYRALVAKRSVAQNTFSSIIGMKSAGSGIDTEFLNAILQELGIPEDEVARILGEQPSYYAQMELLSKKIFQNPQFYINLYDKPANVARKGVALQAIELMLLNDTYNSGLRSEMLMALALELELQKVQEGIQNRVNAQ